MKQLTKNTFKSTLGMAFISTSLILPMASMADNPFAATDLGNGYQLAGKHADDKPGEGKWARANAVKQTLPQSLKRANVGRASAAKKNQHRNPKRANAVKESVVKESVADSNSPGYC